MIQHKIIFMYAYNTRKAKIYEEIKGAMDHLTPEICYHSNGGLWKQRITEVIETIIKLLKSRLI